MMIVRTNLRALVLTLHNWEGHTALERGVPG
jgi:hypothetical protein